MNGHAGDGIEALIAGGESKVVEFKTSGRLNTFTR
jgi:hypothetical protein